MKISVDILKRGLEDKRSFTTYGKIGKGLTLEKVGFFTGAEAKDGQVYIATDPENLPPPRGKISSILLIIGVIDEPLIKAFETVFVFPSGITIFDLHDDVQQIFARYNAWGDNLRHTLAAGSDVQAMIDLSTDIFQNPLILQDSNFTAVAVSSSYASNPSLAPIIDNKSIPYLMKSERFGGRNASDNQAVVPLRIISRPALYVNLYQQGRFQYRLMVLELEGELHDSAAPLLEYLSNFIQLAIGFVVDESKESTSLSHLVKNILMGEFRDPSYIQQRLSEFGWTPEDRLLCARVYADIPDFRNRTLHYMAGRLQEHMKKASVFEHDNAIVLFLKLEDFAGDMKKIETLLTGFLQDNNLKAGLSNPFSGFDHFREYDVQAAAALELGPRIKPYILIHKFRDVTERFIIESCTKKLPASMICAPGLLKLKEHDREHKTDLYHTLFVYLKNNLRAVNAAKELFIHRSTFLYRLDRIRKITGLELENDDDQWYLLFSFKLLGSPDQSESHF